MIDKSLRDDKKRESKIKGVSIEDMIVVESIIDMQKKVHSYCSIDISDVMLYIIGKEIEGIEYIKVFDKNKIIVEILDTSYTRMRNLATLEDWNTRFILCVTFDKNGNANICDCKISEIQPMEYKKTKELTYCVTNGKEIEKINIMQQDIKGMEYRTLKELVGYTFNKKTGKKEDIDRLYCILVKYA
mgnify:CR=1 FL=1